ncbi:hypothetical protein Rhopal_001000-T1 [Rhodotorula paludigena]|uniref:CENP-V/GFA domain-containing protein n=1 Tax=Rhodotorula paludigena TaxID=86838 RepID=A0AAV5GC57_9BASI|nr:hypothetical protein Rhopal_001000-T1 [Rhodotorula paludigena]
MPSEKHTESVPSVVEADKSKPIFPLFTDRANDGFSNRGEDKEASATCLCGAVQISVPTQGPGFKGTFVCHCTDCRKISGSMFATNFTVALSHLKYVRGKDSVKSYGQSETIGAPRNGHTMTEHWCDHCGRLMYRVSSGHPDVAFVRVGAVDDLGLHESVLKPDIELFTKDRVGWLPALQGVKQHPTM